MKPGDSFAQYEIQGPIGAGGMGEVFLAHDTKLRRDVAVKILPPGFATDKERIARFEREARALASLQHANVASIYGFEEVDDRHFLVMEMIEGEDLSKRIERGAVPVETALDIARQIATGLEAAHEKGIIHRDLKPANVKLTPDGQVKILDFGLARAADGEGLDDDPGASPTLTAAMTMEGVILGTAAYMSPEQARGKTADRRADIWAFGALLYEMLTGKRLFGGETVSDTLAAVLRKDPNWDALPSGLDPAVLLLLRRCLERKPVDRLQHIGDARILLDEKLAGEDSSVPTTGRSRIPVLVLAGLLVVSVALNLTKLLENDGASTTAGPQVQHLAASLAPRAPLARARAHPLGIGRPTLSISPDGASLVYVAEVDGQTQLHKKRFDAALAEKFPGTEGAFHPVFSPKGDWVAFFTGDKLRKVLYAGSEPVTLCEVRNPFSLTWESESSLLVAANEGTDILRVDAGSGSSTKLHEGDYIGYLSPLPGSSKILVHRLSSGLNPDSWSVGSIDLNEGSYQSIIEGGFSPRYVPTGHLVYVRGGNLMGIAFDLDKLQTRGQAVPVVAGLRIARRSLPTYDFSADGILVYVSGPPATLSHLVWADRQGGITKLPLPPQFYGDFQISPDGLYVAAMVGGDRDDIWIYEMERGTRRKLNTDGDAFHPIWSPDGKYLAFGSRRGESVQTYIRPVDGSEPARPIGVEGVPGSSPYAWISENEIVLTGDGDINVVDIVKKTIIPAATTDASEWGPHFSPNGHWMAYTSDESGQYEVYVKPYPELSGAWAISSNGGEEPIWSRDGKSLYYRNGDTWLEVPISFDPDFSMGTPRVVLEGPFINVPGRSYDLSADGERFLVILDEGTEEFSRHVEVVLNWFDELERLVPTR